jgi:hypothetical protein
VSKRSYSFRLVNSLMVGTLRQERAGVKQRLSPVEIHTTTCPRVGVDHAQTRCYKQARAFLLGLTFGTTVQLRLGVLVCLTASIMLFVCSPYRQ